MQCGYSPTAINNFWFCWLGFDITSMLTLPLLCLQELEESRRLFASQKRALKDALSAAAEREAAEAEADAAGRTAATAAAEEEMERLLQVGCSSKGGRCCLLAFAGETWAAGCVPQTSC
jgi:hypothetical protein